MARRILMALMYLGLSAGSAWSQLPATSLQATYPVGGKPGTEVELKIYGNDLDGVDRLLCNHPQITATVKLAEPGPFDEKPPVLENTFVVKIGPDVQPGYYELRCQGKYGLSNPRLFLVTANSHQLETEPNNEASQAEAITGPVVLHGQIRGQADIDCFRLNATAGQRILIRGLAQRVDSPLELSMSLTHPSGQTVATAIRTIEGDLLLDLTAPADGQYLLEIHDVTFQQGDTLVYCLEIGDFPYIAAAFPTAIPPGTTAPITLYGRNLPGGKPSSLTLDGMTLEELVVQVEMPSEPAQTNPLARRIAPHQAGQWDHVVALERGDFLPATTTVSAATAPLIPEAADNDLPQQAQSVAWPCEIVGRLYPQADMDWFTFSAHKDDVIAIELYSNRLGLPTDPALLLQLVQQNEQGEEQVREITFIDDLNRPNNNFQRGYHEFDMSSSDPSFLLTVPEDGTYRVMIKDSYSSVRSDPRTAYRLAIRPPQPGFHAVAVPGDSIGSLLLRKGGRDYVRIYVDRHDGFDGPITCAMTDLPAGVSTDEIVIGPGNNLGTFVLHCADDCEPVLGYPRVTASARINDVQVSQAVPFGVAVQPFQFAQPNSNIVDAPARLTETMVVCVSDHESAPVSLSLSGPLSLETSRGGILKIPYTVKRKDEIGGNLIGFPMNLPINVQANQVNIGNNNEGEFDIRFLANTPPGTYSFYLAGYMQNMRYSRNPEAAEGAKQEQERITRLFEEAGDQLKAAQQADQQAQQKLTQLNQQLAQAKTAAQQKQQELTAASQKHEALQTQITTAAEQANANPDDAALQQQLVSLQKELEVAAAAKAAAEKQATDANTQLETLTTDQTAADQAKQASAKALSAAQTRQQQAQQAKQQADQVARQAAQAANPRNFNEHVPSNTLTITVHEFPITVGLDAPMLDIRQGEKASLVIPVERRFEFAGDINIQVQRPGNLGSLQVANARLAADAKEATLEFTAADNTPAGEHQATIRLQMNFNGQNLQLDLPLKVIVREKPAEEDA